MIHLNALFLTTSQYFDCTGIYISPYILQLKYLENLYRHNRVINLSISVYEFEVISFFFPSMIPYL